MTLLLCDLDDTLVHRAPVFREWAESFTRQGRHADDLVEWLIEQDRGGYRPRHEFLGRVAERTGIDQPLEELAERYNEEFPTLYRLQPAVHTALDDVRRAGWGFAVVTNGDPAVQSTKLRATGLDRMVDAVCISDDVGLRKPDPRIFALAAERAGATLDGAWMIGDRLEADIAGARAAGIRSVWIDIDSPWAERPAGDLQPDRTATSFPDAVRLVLSDGA